MLWLYWNNNNNQVCLCMWKKNREEKYFKLFNAEHDIKNVYELILEKFKIIILVLRKNYRRE